MRETDRTVRQSILDRLVDLEPRVPADPPQPFSESVRQLKAHVLRDLEWLLNTRRIAEPAPDRFPEVQRSVYHFGLPDTTSLSGDDPTVRSLLQQQIEECLRLFEPRLSNVEVSIVASTEATRRQLRFVVDGLLRMDPNPERITFDTVLDVSSGAFSVGGATNA